MDDPTFPALSRGSKWNPVGQYGLYDGSFFRIQSAQLSYSLPARWTKRIGIDKLQFYVNGRNLWLWSLMPDDGVGANHDLKELSDKETSEFWPENTILNRRLKLMQ